MTLQSSLIKKPVRLCFIPKIKHCFIIGSVKRERHELFMFQLRGSSIRYASICTIAKNLLKAYIKKMIL